MTANNKHYSTGKEPPLAAGGLVSSKGMASSRNVKQRCLTKTIINRKDKTMNTKQLTKLITKAVTARCNCIETVKETRRDSGSENFRQRLLLDVVDKCGGWSMSVAERGVPSETLLKNTFDRIDAIVDFWEKVNTLAADEQETIRADYYPMESQSTKEIFAKYGLEIKQYAYSYIE